jgi:glycosyltransferase involved in cell wall biosynthesis
MATRMPTILFVQPVAERGGSDHALLRMVRALRAAGFTTHVALPSASPMAEEFHAAGAHLHTVPMLRITTRGGRGHWVRYAAAWPVSVWRLAALARRVGADVVHTNSLHSWYGWAVAALLRRPHVWHAREIVVQSAAALRVERALARRFAARVVAISHAVAAQLDPSNVTVLHDEPEPDEFHPSLAGRFRPRLGIPDDVPVAAFVGRLDTWKGVDVLLDAWQRADNVVDGAVLVIAGGVVAGKEAEAARWQERAGRLPRVVWAGERDDVADLLADVDVFVHASTEPEPYGLVVVEALATGVPVIVSDAGGAPEILQGASAGAGRLVAPGDADAVADALVELLPEHSSTPQRAARTVLVDTTPPDYAALYRTVLDRSR